MKNLIVAVLFWLMIGTSSAIASWAQEQAPTPRSPRVPRGEFDIDAFKVYRPASSEECSPKANLSGFEEPFQFWKADEHLSTQVRELSIEAPEASFKSLRRRVDRAMDTGREYDLLILPSQKSALLVPTERPRGDIVEEISEEDFVPCRYLVVAGDGVDRGIYSHVGGNLEIDRNRRYLPAAKGSILEVDREDPEVKTREIDNVERKYVKVDVDDSAGGRFRCYTIDPLEGSRSRSKVSPAIYYLTNGRGEDTAIPIAWCPRAAPDQKLPGGSEPGASIGMQRSVEIYNYFAEENGIPTIISLEKSCDPQKSTLKFLVELSHLPETPTLPRPLAVVAAYSYFTDHKCNAANQIRWSFSSSNQGLPGEEATFPPDITVARGDFQGPDALLKKLQSTLSWSRVEEPDERAGGDENEKLRLHFNKMMEGRYPKVKRTSVVNDSSGQITFDVDLAEADTEVPRGPLEILCSHLYASRDDCQSSKTVSCLVPSQGWELKAEVPEGQSCNASAIRNLWR